MAEHDGGLREAWEARGREVMEDFEKHERNETREVKEVVEVRGRQAARKV